MSPAGAVERIPIVYQAKQAVHPELARGLTWHGIRRVLAREDVALLEVPLRRSAQLVHFDGAWAVLLSKDAPGSRSTFFVAHELAHLWLHHDAGVERWERCFNMSYDCGPDPREDEADIMANLLLGGPEFLRRYWR